MRTSGATSRTFRYAIPPSPRSGSAAAKFTRRRPRLTVAAGATGSACLIGLVLTTSLQSQVNGLLQSTAAREAEYAEMKAVAAARDLRDDLRSLEFLLGSSVEGAESEQRTEWTALAAKALARHQVAGPGDWTKGPLLSTLNLEQRKQVVEDMGELLLLVAGAHARQGRIDLALQLNGRAMDCYANDSIPPHIMGATCSSLPPGS